MDRIRVVIADDSDQMREFIKNGISSDEKLEIAGEAKDGLEACELVSREKPDVLLLDLIMPKMDGMSVLEHLAAQKDLPKCPAVIIISAVSSDRMIREAFDRGAVYYFIKPFHLNTLIGRIKETVRETDGGSFSQRILSDGKTGGQTLRAVESAVSDLFHALGIPAHLKGYQYLKDAVLLALFRKNHIYSITKDIYPVVAKQNHASAPQVERAMRHAIETGWCRGDMDVIDRLFGYTVRHECGKPTNSEFIALIADWLRVKFFD